MFYLTMLLTYFIDGPSVRHALKNHRDERQGIFRMLYPTDRICLLFIKKVNVNTYLL